MSRAKRSLCRPENRTVPPTTTLSPNMSLSAKFSSVMADMKAKASAAVAAVRVDGLSDGHATTPGFWEDPEASRQALKGALFSLADGPYAVSVGVLERSNFGRVRARGRAQRERGAQGCSMAWHPTSSICGQGF